MGVLRADERLKEAMSDLLAFATDKAIGGDYRFDGRQAQGGDIVHSVSLDGVEVGFCIGVNPVSDIQTRRVFLKTPGYKLSEIPKKQLEAAVISAFDVFVVTGGEPPVIAEIADDCLLIEQRVAMTRIMNLSPGLVSIFGGMDA